jgi:CDP-diacylglycerol--glycerol-3-phosphate 3-phosphatidyltransferase
MGLSRQNIPNALTILRLVLAVVFFVMLALAGADARALLIAASVVFAVAAITDALDGYLARRWNAISAFGRVMDPFADKILVLGGFVMLAGANFVAGPGAVDAAAGVHLTGVASWMPVAILGRELLITSIRGVYEARGVDFSASASGKVKMVAQSVAVPAILLIAAFHEPIGTEIASRINTGIAWFVVAITALSAVPYLTRAARHAAAAREPGSA